MSQPIVTLHLNNASNRRIASYPVTYGVPLPEGSLKRADGLIAKAGGTARPLQTRVLETWPDKSIKWLLLDFDVALPKNKVTDVDIVPGKPAAKAGGIKVRQTANHIKVKTAALEVSINRKDFALFDSYKVGGKEMVGGDSDIVIEMPQGQAVLRVGCEAVEGRGG